MTSKLFAGVVNSGGGKSVVCYSDKSKLEISTVKSLDLVEGELLERHTHSESDLPFEMQVEQVIKKIPEDNPWRMQLENWSKVIIQGFKILPAGVALKPVEDSYEVFLYDKNCEIQQLAHFLKTDSIIINGDQWLKMSNTQKAALVLHETVYYLTRLAGEENSKRARRIVSFLMSENMQIIAPTSNIPKESHICYGESTNNNTGAKKKSLVYAYKKNDNSFDFDFLILNGKIKLSKSTINIPIQHFPPRPWEKQVFSDNILDSNFEGEATNLKIEMNKEVTGPVKFAMMGDASGYYGETVEPVTLTCQVQFSNEKTNYYLYQTMEVLYIPAQGFACSEDVAGRKIFNYSSVPINFYYESQKNEKVYLAYIDIYIKDSSGNYQRINIKNQDLECLTGKNGLLNPDKNEFRKMLNFEIPSNVFDGKADTDLGSTSNREAVVRMRLRKEFENKQPDDVEYRIPFKVIKLN